MLTTSDTARYAALVALDLSDDELAAMTDYLNDMEEFTAVLDKVNTDGVEPMYSPLDSDEMPRRQDIPQRFPDVETIMKNAPDVRDGFIAVKKVIEKK